MRPKQVRGYREHLKLIDVRSKRKGTGPHLQDLRRKLHKRLREEGKKEIRRAD